MVINNDRHLERAEILREKGTNRSQFFRGLVDKYTWVDIGSSYVSSDILAAYLYAQLENMTEITVKREKIHNLYYEALLPLVEQGFITLPVIPAECESNDHMFYVLLRGNETRMKLIAHLKKNSILAVFHYVPLHTSPVGKNMGYRNGMLPVTEDISERLLRLPFYYELEESDIYAVVKEIFSFFSV